MQNYELIRCLENAGLNGVLENHFEEIFTFNPVVDEAERLYKQTARYEAQFPQTEIQIADLSKLTTEELISNILGNQ